jgi:hypothetical protein
MAALVAAPLVLIIFLMAVLRWSAAGAGLLGLVAVTVGATGFFGFGTRVHGEQGIVGVLIGTGAEAGSRRWTLYGSFCRPCPCMSFSGARARSRPSGRHQRVCPRTRLCLPSSALSSSRRSWKERRGSAHPSPWPLRSWSASASRRSWRSLCRSSVMSWATPSARSALRSSRRPTYPA